MHEPTSLRDLVEAAALKREASDRRLAEIADAAGHRITETTISAIRQGSYTSTPSAETIRAIAWLAGVGEEAAFAAAGQKAGAPTPEPAEDHHGADQPQWPDLNAFRGPTAISGREPYDERLREESQGGAAD